MKSQFAFGIAVIILAVSPDVLATESFTPAPRDNKEILVAQTADDFWVHRKILGGDPNLCSTFKGRGVPPSWMRCSGPYKTEKEASDWIAKNGDENGNCLKVKCSWFEPTSAHR